MSEPSTVSVYVNPVKKRKRPENPHVPVQLRKVERVISGLAEENKAVRSDLAVEMNPLDYEEVFSGLLGTVMADHAKDVRMADKPKAATARFRAVWYRPEESLARGEVNLCSMRTSRGAYMTMRTRAEAMRKQGNRELLTGEDDGQLFLKAASFARWEGCPWPKLGGVEVRSPGRFKKVRPGVCESIHIKQEFNTEDPDRAVQAFTEGLNKTVAEQKQEWVDAQACQCERISDDNNHCKHCGVLMPADPATCPHPEHSINVVRRANGPDYVECLRCNTQLSGVCELPPDRQLVAFGGVEYDLPKEPEPKPVIIPVGEPLDVQKERLKEVEQHAIELASKYVKNPKVIVDQTPSVFLVWVEQFGNMPIEVWYGNQGQVGASLMREIQRLAEARALEHLKATG